MAGETQEPGLGARGVNKQGIVAGHRNAPDEVQELLEIQLPVTIQIEFLHHPVHDTWVLLILQKTKEMGIDVCLEAKMPLWKEPPCPRCGTAAAEFITSGEGLAEEGRIQSGQLLSGHTLASDGSELFPLPTPWCLWGQRL